MVFVEPIFRFFVTRLIIGSLSASRHLSKYPPDHTSAFAPRTPLPQFSVGRLLARLGEAITTALDAFDSHCSLGRTPHLWNQRAGDRLSSQPLKFLSNLVLCGLL